MTGISRLQQRRWCALLLCLVWSGLGMTIEAGAAPALPVPGVTPGAITGSTTVQVEATVKITDSTLITGSVQLLQVNESNAVIARLGTMTDDGLAPDLVAGDRVFAKRVTISAPSAPAKVRFRVSAAFTGMLQRVLSDATIIDVTPSGIPTTVGSSDPVKIVTDDINGFRLLSNEVIVGFKEGTSLDEVQRVTSLVSGTLIGRIPEIHAWQIQIPDTGSSAGVQAAIGTLLTQFSVDVAEPNVVPQVSSHLTVLQTLSPNNIYLPQINLSKAHSKSTGTGLKIAVIDTGVEATNPGLTEHLIRGQNFVSVNLADPPDDFEGHGTHVAGIAGMIAPESRVMPIRSLAGACDPLSLGTLKNVASGFKVLAGVVYAASKDVDVINMSLETPFLVRLMMRKAVEYAQSKGILIVASAGNNGGSAPQVPAALNGVLSVGAVDQFGYVSSGANSNYGTWVKIYAPGELVVSTWPSYPVSLDNCPFSRSGGFMKMNGTSQAAPFVSGVAALVKKSGGGLSSKDVHDVIIKSGQLSQEQNFAANPIKDLDGNLVCKLNAGNAVSLAEFYKSDPRASNRTACGGPFLIVSHPGLTSVVDFTVTIENDTTLLTTPVTLGPNSSTVIYLTDPLSSVNPLTLSDPKAVPPLKDDTYKVTIRLVLAPFEFKVAGYRLTLSPGHKFTDGTTEKVGLLNRAIRQESHDFNLLAEGGIPIPTP